QGDRNSLTDKARETTMPKVTRRELLGAPLGVALGSAIAASGGSAAAQAPSNQLPLAKGPFQPTADSLKTYQAPDWFRDAKFGIWAHWGPIAGARHGSRTPVRPDADLGVAEPIRRLVSLQRIRRRLKRAFGERKLIARCLRGSTAARSGDRRPQCDAERRT